MLNPLNNTDENLPAIAAGDLNYILEKTERLWQEIRGQRVFLTGGTGFFGSWLLESFVAANQAFNLQAQAVVLSRSPEKFRLRAPHVTQGGCVELVQGDVRDFEFPAGEFSFVIHAATESVPKGKSTQAEEMFSVGSEGTRRCLEFAESRGTKKMLLTSSGAVYGRQPDSMTHIAEDYADDCGGAPDVLRENYAYAEGKRVAEMLCAAAARRGGMECKIARCFAFVGPHLPLDAHFAIGNFIRDAMRGEAIRIQGDGTPMRSYLYAADLAVWLWTMMFAAPSGRAFNVGSNRAVSIREVAEAVVAAVHPGLEITVAQERVADAPVQRYVPSVAAAKTELKLEEGFSLEDAIRRTAAWYGADISI